MLYMISSLRPNKNCPTLAVGYSAFFSALPTLKNMDRVYTSSESYQYHAIIALIAMSDNREPRCNNLSILYSFNTGQKRKSGNGTVASMHGLCYNRVASGATLLK